MGPDWQYSWPFRRRSTARAIGNLEADVVGLQEAFGFQLAYLAKSLPEFAITGEGRNRRRSGEHCAILFRRDRLELLESRTYWFGETPDLPGSKLPGASFARIATSVHLRDQISGLEFRLTNTHLDEKVAANRAGAARQITQNLDGDQPSLVVGDFNTTQDDRAVFNEFAAGNLQSAVPDPGGGTTHRFGGKTGQRQIDHILASPHWQVLGTQVVTVPTVSARASDHWPVRAQVLTRDI